MAAIDIGSGAIDRASYLEKEYTGIDKGNPANGTGKLTSVETWFATAATAGVKIGTFYGSGLSWTSRDHEAIGAVTAGSKQTFSGLDIDVQANDCIGCYMGGVDGEIEYASSGGSASTCYKSGDQFGAGTQTYTGTDGLLSLYGTGATAGWANIAKINGVTATDIAKVCGVAVADIAKVNGVAV